MSGAAPERVGLPEGAAIVVIAGPGGVGKGTLVAQLISDDDRLWLSRSWTTRDPRPGEAPDAYNFVDRSTFEAHIDSGGFLEWTEFLDYLQGSPVPAPPEGRDVVFEIDVAGAANISQLYPESLLIFVDAPSRAEQETRLRGRGDSEERVRQRLEKAEQEVERARDLDFVYVVNDDLATTVAELKSVIDRHRSRC